MLCPPAERPQFYEIYKQRAVLGISLLFMAIDLLGGTSSIVSLAFKRQLDVLAAVAYSPVVVRPYRLNPAFLLLTNVLCFGYPGLVIRTHVMDGLVLVLAVILNRSRETQRVRSTDHG
jgi:hypothetical protein